MHIAARIRGAEDHGGFFTSGELVGTQAVSALRQRRWLGLIHRHGLFTIRTQHADRSRLRAIFMRLEKDTDFVVAGLFDTEGEAGAGVLLAAVTVEFADTILVLVSSLQAVGCILSVGLMVAPAATVYLLTNNARTLFWGGGIIGAVGSVIAFFLSYPLGWSVSATIIVVLGIFFLLAYIFSPKYGLFSRRRGVA